MQEPAPAALAPVALVRVASPGPVDRGWGASAAVPAAAPVVPAPEASAEDLVVLPVVAVALPVAVALGRPSVALVGVVATLRSSSRPR